MTTTTKKKTKPKPKPDAMERYIAEIDRFADMLRAQQVSIKELEDESAAAKAALDEVRGQLHEARDVEHSTVSLLLKFIRPGSIDVMPLFDTMEPAEEDIHGQYSDEWRKEPIVLLELSAAALRALIDANIVLVGQLQDRILKGDDWAAALEGINPGMAEAIAAKLQQFVEERSRKR